MTRISLACGLLLAMVVMTLQASAELDYNQRMQTLGGEYLDSQNGSFQQVVSDGRAQTIFYYSDDRYLVWDEGQNAFVFDEVAARTPIYGVMMSREVGKYKEDFNTIHECHNFVDNGGIKLLCGASKTYDWFFNSTVSKVVDVVGDYLPDVLSGVVKEESKDVVKKTTKGIVGLLRSGKSLGKYNKIVSILCSLIEAYAKRIYEVTGNDTMIIANLTSSNINSKDLVELRLNTQELRFYLDQDLSRVDANKAASYVGYQVIKQFNQELDNIPGIEKVPLNESNEPQLDIVEAINLFVHGESSPCSEFQKGRRLHNELIELDNTLYRQYAKSDELSKKSVDYLIRRRNEADNALETMNALESEVGFNIWIKDAGLSGNLTLAKQYRDQAQTDYANSLFVSSAKKAQLASNYFNISKSILAQQKTSTETEKGFPFGAILLGVIVVIILYLLFRKRKEEYTP